MISVEGNGKALVAGVALAISILLYFTIPALRRRSSSRGTRDCGPRGLFPRGPPAWPLIGHLPLLRARPHQVLADLSLNQGYGPIMGLRLGSHRAVVVSSAASAKELLLTHDKAFANRVPYLFTNTLFYGYDTAVIFSSYNPHWAWLRKVYTLELFTAKRLHELRHVRHDELRKLLHRLRQASQGGSQVVDLGIFLAEMTANTTSRLIYSKTLTEAAPQLPHLIRAIEEVAFPTLSDFLPFFKFMDGLPKRRMKHLHYRIDKILDSIVNERRQLMTRCPHHELPNDFLQVILDKEVNNEDKEVITPIELKGVLLDMFLAGIDTTTTTLEWAIAELLRNPQCLHKLYKEVDLATKDKKEIVTDEDVQNMSYLENVVKEVLRLHPVVPLLVPRISSMECKVEDYILPKGTHAFINVWAIARDPMIWERPKDFYPERFEGKDLDIRGQHYELLPFGGGRRICPGMRLGLSVVQVTLANLVKFFDWELPNGQKPSSLDMSEKSGLGSGRKSSMVAIPKFKY